MNYKQKMKRSRTSLRVAYLRYTMQSRPLHPNQPRQIDYFAKENNLTGTPLKAIDITTLDKISLKTHYYLDKTTQF